MTQESGGTVDPDEPVQWEALRDADLAILPPEALAASIRHLAQRLLDLTHSGRPEEGNDGR